MGKSWAERRNCRRFYDSLADVHTNSGVSMGGYLTGRLRTKWVRTHNYEIYFRDTVHGFLAWAVASLISAVLLTTSIGTIVGGSAKVVGSVAGGAASASLKGVMTGASGYSPMSGSTVGYFVNSLFRSGSRSSVSDNSFSSGATASDTTALHETLPQNQSVSPSRLAEVTGIFTNSFGSDSLPSEDLHYVAQLVSQYTGINQNEAVQRVENIYAKVQTKLKDAKTAAINAAETARKTTSYIALWTFISLLIGAFVASLAATSGGRQRDI